MSNDWISPDFGLKSALGFTLENRDGASVTVLELSDIHLNPNGTVHGAVPSR